MYYDRMITIRANDVHLKQLAQVAEAREESKSEVLRQLIAKAADEVKNSRPAPADEEPT